MIRSEEFDDIYFSAEGGLAETQYVFLANNNLPAAWAGRHYFTIAETGFGTGLNFLAAWKLFEETASPDAVLDYISFELYPLGVTDIERALAQWRDSFGDRFDRMVRNYPMRIPGWHRIDFGRVRLTLVFADVSESVPHLTIPRGVDAWFLDGFAPAKNPQMWTKILFENMARLSHADTTFSSFTAAALVKSGLREAGFIVEKRRGYGRKRDMIAGRYGASGNAVHRVRPENVAVIGAGLAGTACASVLRARGISHTVFDVAQDIATGASGNDLGIFNPRLTASRTPDSDFYANAFALTARTLAHIPDIDFMPCGSLHLITNQDKKKRFESCKENWGWPDDHMSLLTPSQSSSLAGVDIAYDALFLPDSGQVSPRKLCRHWIDGSDLVLNKSVDSINLDDFDHVILACAISAKDMVPWLPLETVRGQILNAAASARSQALAVNICYGGYIGAVRGDMHVLGSTFQKWIKTTDLRPEDNIEILQLLEQVIPHLGVSDIKGARASLRCAAQDRFPLIGAVPERAGFYVTVAHGSHGIVSALAGAHLIADMIEGNAYSQPQNSVNILSPQRFIDRAARRGQIVL